IIRVLNEDGQALVASPAYLDRHGRPRTPEDLARLDSVDMARSGGEHVWRLTSPDGGVRNIPHQPRLTTDDMVTLRRAALDGVGAVQLPLFVIGQDIAAGTLETLLPRWASASWLVHAVFPSRRGLVPAVRTFLDVLAEDFAAPHPC
ncbi:MAG: LysR family transcriptional regulator, partial [Rhodospirillales bacterium]|nr:LysR family transcriptional regulator [Rhodospirillales bacterium]